MNNLQYSSGERNHYFYGKLMTVRDFPLSLKESVQNRFLQEKVHRKAPQAPCRSQPDDV